ncbi:MAG: ROK family protein [Prevotellaceae bacterium]|jgi:glucokinase|nr:ROK family protein [Prevotellaceae bacterium]
MILSIDLGGTNIRIAQVENGRCTNKASVPCRAGEDAATVIGQLSGLIRGAMTPQVTGIGIGVPSIVSADGIVYNVANIASWREVHLKELLEEEFGIPVAVGNDADCFALGENLYGSGRSYADMVGITIGTGIGAGVIVNHRLYGGEYDGAGEVGSLPYRDSDFEHYCSSIFFKRFDTTGAALARRAQHGDAGALDIWRQLGHHIGQLMKAILFAYSPKAIIIGGGISQSYPLFQESMLNAMDDFPYPLIAKGVRIGVSELEDASLLGASALLN